jgi:Fur family ferric uptake transcriptional regulator
LIDDPYAGWDTRLRACGLRSTIQRRAVLGALAELRHATVDELAARVQETNPEVNLSTVYRTLEVLGEVGLVTHAHLHHGAPTYHVVDDDPHLHLVCTRCGSVQSQPVESARDLADRALAGSGFQVDLAHLVLHGRCSGCAAAPADPEPAEIREGPGSSGGTAALPHT